MDKKFRVFATCDIGEAIDLLRKRGYEVDVYPQPEAPPKSLIVDKVKSGIDGLITTLRDPIDAEVFEAGKMWTAEHLTRENRWGYWHPYLPFLGDEVTGKNVAVIGTGRIGLAFIKKCVGFDLNVLCYDPAYQNHAFVKTIQELADLRHARGMTREKAWIKYVPFDEALRHADFVSVHVPLLRPGESATPTYHLFNEQTLRLMKSTAFLMNTSRGPVIDEAALARALKENWIAGAALDVYEQEPLPADSPLRDPDIEDRCRLMPHFASAARITRLSVDPARGMAGRCVQGLIDVLEQNYGGDVTQMPYVVNKEAFR